MLATCMYFRFVNVELKGAYVLRNHIYKVPIYWTDVCTSIRHLIFFWFNILTYNDHLVTNIYCFLFLRRRVAALCHQFWTECPQNRYHLLIIVPTSLHRHTRILLMRMEYPHTEKLIQVCTFLNFEIHDITFWYLILTISEILNSWKG